MGNLEQAAEKTPLIVLTGQPAVGKTALSIQLARRIGGEIISADSMQVYRHMDIGTAKIRLEEMDGVPHHLIDILEPTEDFNVVRPRGGGRYLQPRKNSDRGRWNRLLYSGTAQ